MKKHRGHGSCLPCRNNSLGNLCGTSIDTDDIDFTGPRSNLVYMDKVFAFKEATSCPILSCVNTGGMNANNFIAEIEIKDPSNGNSCCGHNDCDCGCGCGCGCGCHVTCNCNCSAAINRNSIFNIDKSFVVVEYFNTRPPGNPPCVSIDGFDVDCVKFSNGQFIVNTDQVNAQVQRDRCQDAGLPTKAFLLINCAGPWDFRAKYVLEGTVNTDGRVSCFRAEIFNAPGRPNSSLPNTALSNFAIPNFSIPCSINGIAPSIQFQFDADIELIRPKLTIKSRQSRPRGNDDCDREESSRNSDCICICNNNGEDFTVVLTGNLAVEPKVHVETIRKTLFCVNACEALQPCDGSDLAAEMEDEEDIDPFAPDCSCANTVASVVSPAEDCGCNNHRNRVSAEEDCGCNNNNANTSRGNCSCSGNSGHDRCQNAFNFNGCTGCSW